MNIRLLTMVLSLAGGFIFSPSSQAQHFDVFVGRPTVGTQTAYGGIDVDTADITLGLRVFESEMGEDPFDGTFVSDEPGFNHPADDSALPAGAASLNDGDEIFVSALPLTVDAATDSLFYWNGLGSVAFAPAVGFTFTIDTGNMTGSIGSAGAGGGFDDHPFFILDDGDANPATVPTPGIYLASFQASVAELDPTDPLYLVMGTEGLITADFLGISQEDFDMLTEDDLDELLEGVIEQAVEFVERNVVVPEPNSLVLGLAFFQMGILRRRR
ncbi:MAG: hypothetical protein SH868_05640 [Bythopirellula sp.]|nr:hypothetical protein [Bythopirellula sp.]